VILIFEKVFVQGPVASFIKKRFGKTRISHVSRDSDEDSFLLERMDG